mgnify:CR=1 FL=1
MGGYPDRPSVVARGSTYRRIRRGADGANISDIMNGGCQCGRIRYSAIIATLDAHICHCRICQRATGGVSIAFVNLPNASPTWGTEPEWYRFSPIAHRPVCAACGTPLGLEFVVGENCDLTVGCFDNAAHFVPTSQFGIGSRYDAWTDTMELSGVRCDDHAAPVERWAKVGTGVPEYAWRAGLLQAF